MSDGLPRRPWIRLEPQALGKQVLEELRWWLNNLSAEGGAKVQSGEVSRASTQVS